jgi:hypothetical protein
MLRYAGILTQIRGRQIPSNAVENLRISGVKWKLIPNLPMVSLTAAQSKESIPRKAAIEKLWLRFS